MDNEINIGDGKIDLEPIKLSFFPQNFADVEQFSLFSWISFVGVLLSLGIIIYWIFLLIKASFDALNSKDDEAKLKSSFEEIKAIFTGIGFTIVVPLILSVIGIFTNIGPFWNWPTAFKLCKNNPDATFYFQAIVQDREIDLENAEQNCL